MNKTYWVNLMQSYAEYYHDKMNQEEKEPFTKEEKCKSCQNHIDADNPDLCNNCIRSGYQYRSLEPFTKEQIEVLKDQGLTLKQQEHVHGIVAGYIQELNNPEPKTESEKTISDIWEENRPNFKEGEPVWVREYKEESYIPAEFSHISKQTNNKTFVAKVGIYNKKGFLTNKYLNFKYCKKWEE